MRRKPTPARDRLDEALEALKRDGEPYVVRDGKRPVGVLISVEDFRKHFSGRTKEPSSNGDGPTWPQVERRRGERRRGDRRGQKKARSAPKHGDPGATLDVLRELRSLGISAER